MKQLDLQAATLHVETRGADLGTAVESVVRPGTTEDKPGDSPLTVEEWAEAMAPHFHAASQLVPNFWGGKTVRNEKPQTASARKSAKR